MDNDNAAKQRARVAWIEWYMFPKTCLCRGDGSKAKKRRNSEARFTRLERWAAGERATLWEDAPRRKAATATAKKPDAAKEEATRIRNALKYAGLGMPGKAVSALTSQRFICREE